MSETKDVPIKDIPQTLMDEIRGVLENFIVLIMIQNKLGSPSAELNPVGSGTLVEVERRNFLLTAAHVWNAARSAERIHLVLSTLHPTSFSVSPDHLSPQKIWDQKNSEWSPDLALLEFAPSDTATLKAYRSFLNLSLQKEALSVPLPPVNKGLGVVTGLVEEFSRVERFPEKHMIRAHLIARAFFSIVDEQHEANGYDYYDVGAKMELEDVPSSFGGVSGGGLWQIELSGDRDGNNLKWSGKRFFRGVAFYQSENLNGRRVIRCHGPKSIFEMAWKQWGLGR